MNVFQVYERNLIMLLLSGREYHKNDPAVTVDYNTADPVVRWDSYENFNQRFQDSLEGNFCQNFQSYRDSWSYIHVQNMTKN